MTGRPGRGCCNYGTAANLLQGCNGDISSLRRLLEVLLASVADPLLPVRACKTRSQRGQIGTVAASGLGRDAAA